MLKFTKIDENNIAVSVNIPENEISLEDDEQTRFLGDIIKKADEHKFFTTPSEYLHALWWIEDGDLEQLKQKIFELNNN